MNRFLFALLLLLGLFVACREDFDITTNRQVGPIPTVNVESSLTGHVVDANGAPLEGAAVEVAGLTLTTNAQGLFFVHQKLMDKNGTHIKVSKSGYFNAAKFAFPRLGANAYMEINLIKKSFYIPFDAIAGANILNGSNVAVSIPANAIANANGQPYTGTVHAYLIWLDPSDNNTYRLMPGDLRAIDSAGYAKILKTFGMIGVELESPSGEKLNLRPGKKAQVSMNVPNDLLPDAPATIALWHFDEADGYWKEEGMATLTGNKYEYEVGHFSFWNCDVPTDYILLSGRVANQAGNPITSIYVLVTSQNFGQANTWTDNDGKFSGAVPNELLTIKILDNCGSVLYQQNIGPFNGDKDLGTIEIDLLNPLIISGTLLDCNLQPVADGIAIIATNDTILAVVPTNANGQFSMVHADCMQIPALVVTGIDYTNGTQSTPLYFPQNNTILDIGDIKVCNSLDEYIRVTFEGTTKTFYSNLRFITQNDTEGMALGKRNYTDSISNCSISFQNYANLEADITSLNVSMADGDVIHIYGCDYCSTCNCLTTDTGKLIFTSYPTAPGQYAIGNADGYIRSNGILVPYSLNFRLKR